ncbi:hypothetical protein, conserved [Trypanosoma cruzi]|uniref:Uncharacterized protein n=1 Tax=Trypanosoma cruzi (strain CL Brener) TaxID=353153 RepID=Q4DTJ0_TRYCC|nr:hypothetical protein, conserved [Trypanosoma cruzi]EAN95850.1 hypothetical protein, conserved [Trypanosoma cruzi]|eukprot:XP_817701.1 hypothetical protein [Trypanosoma cruzi strain CL Brener]
MVHIVGAVKQQLRVSLDERSVAALERAFNTLQGLRTGFVFSVLPSSTAFNELHILCCEAAIGLEQWGMAESCLKIFTGKRAPTRALDARALYCEGLIGLHNIPISFRGRAKVTSHLRCATKIVTGVKIALEEWPKEAHTLAVGVEHLWLAIRDLFIPGSFDSVLDIVAFVLALHEKLGLGGPFSQLQWSTRYAMCLRGVGRHQEAVSQLSTASELVSRVGSERLQLQFLRVQIAFWASLPATRTKQDYTKPVLQALYVAQAFFCGMIDEFSATADLIAAHEKLLLDPEKKEIKLKSRKTMEAEITFSDPALVMDVLSEVVLGLALCGADEVCKISLPSLLQGDSVRPRLFGEFAQAILRARACGALGLAKALDASYLTRTMADALFNCIKAVEGTMDNARMIEDPSERAYTLQIGCVILWNLSLPLLQSETRGKLRHTLKRIVVLLTNYGSCLTGLLVHVAYESSLIEFEEDNPISAIEQIDRALSLNHCVVNAEGKMVFPMDFALLSLRRRCVVRKTIDSSVFSAREDQVIHLIEQARTSNSASNRLVLLQSAVKKLPPLGQVLDPGTLAKERVPFLRERSKFGRAKKHSVVVEPPEGQPPRVITNPAAAHIYYLLLKEAKEEKNPSMHTIVEKVASSLTCIDVLNEADSKELIVMKAEAHLSMAEVLLKNEKSSGGTSSDSTADALSHISAAAKISIKLCAAGNREEWIAVNACLSLIGWYSELFRKGLFLPATVVLGELYVALNQTHVDPNREYKLFHDICFAYIMSVLQSYISSKGEVDGELSCGNLAETLRKTFLYPICEANNPMLRRAEEVCREVMGKWRLPSQRKMFCTLFVCIQRLLDRSPEDSHHPQEQLLFLLGKLNGPVSIEEKRILVNKESLDLLRMDPSVELCGRLATHSMQLPENERVTLELCRIADQLYQDGKLGWGTKTLIGNHTGKEKGHSPNSASSAAVLARGAFPKPTEDDWYWYSDILLHQATVLGRLGTGTERSKRHELEKRVIVAITNSAIAASHGPTCTRVSQITDAYYAFCCTADYFSGALRQLLLPSLRILLSPSMLSILPLSSRGGGSSTEGHAEREALLPLITTMAGIFLTTLSENGAHEEGIKTLNNLLAVLPTKCHKVFRTYEAQFRSNLGLSTAQLVNKVRGGDPEIEAAVWVAIAKNAAANADSTKSWLKALEVLERKPLQRADALLQMAEWMATRNAVSRHELITLLLSALDSVERFSDPQMSRLPEESMRKEGSSRSLRQTMAFSLSGRTICLPDAGSMRSGNNLTGGVGEPASLREIMTAIRIMYLLFVVAPEKPLEEHTFTVCKRSCASTILHYVFCMWNIVSTLIRSKDADKENALKENLLEIPEEFHAWQGFCADPQHIDFIRVSCQDDAPQNTDKLWGMLFDVCEFLVEEHWEQFTFMIFSWIEFAANWRYGPLDPRTMAVVRAVRCKCLLAGARSGWGNLSSMYQVEAPTSEYWSAIQEILLSAENSSHFSPWPDGALRFTDFRGSTCYCVLSEAEDLFLLGRVQEALRWSGKVLNCALHIGNIDAVVRCRLLEARARILRGEGAAVAKQLSEIEEEFVGLTFRLWTELNLVRVDALISCGHVEKAISLARNLPQALGLRLTKIAPDGLAGDISNDLLKDCTRRILCECGRQLLAFLRLSLRRSSFPGESEDAARKYLAEVGDQLQKMDDWQSLSTALCIKQNLHPPMDEVLLTTDVEKGKELLEILYTEYCEALRVTELIRSEMNVVAPFSLYTKSLATHPSILRAYDEVLVIRARNCLERELLRDFIILQYDQLSMEQLGIPTGGPRKLDTSVLQYMRDPAAYEQMKKNMTAGSGKESSERGFYEDYNPTRDLECALNHFSIPQAHVEGASSAEAEAMLSRTVKPDGECTPLQMEAVICVALAEFQRRLKALLRAEDATLAVTLTGVAQIREDKGIGFRENDMLTRKWVRLIPNIGQLGSRRASRKRALSVSRKSRKSFVTEPPKKEEGPVNLWVNEDSNLPFMIQLGAKHARRLLEYKELAKCYICLAHNLVLSDDYCAAGTAIEFAQAAEMCGFLLDIQSALLQSSPESNLIRFLERMKLKASFLLNTSAFDSMRNLLMNTSSMLKLFDIGCEWPAEPNKPQPLSSDSCALSVVREESTRYFLVALRCPEGGVHSRRVQLDINSLIQCGDEFETFKQTKKVEIINKNASVKASLEGTSAALLKSLLDRVQYLLAPLWEDFNGILSWLAPNCHLFLCLDPILQSLPLERLSPCTQFLSVQRELSVFYIRNKMSIRGGKSSSGGSLFIVDPFGEHETSLQTLFGPESRPKGATSEVICSVRDKYGGLCNPSQQYIRQALTANSRGILLVDLCGSFTDIVSPETLMELNLEHFLAVLVAEGTNDSSLRREQKQRTSKTTLSLYYERQFIFSLLLLARGVQCVVTNALLPLSPEECGLICRRCLPAIFAGGKGLSEAVRGGTGEGADSFASAFLFYGVPPTVKQK